MVSLNSPMELFQYTSSEILATLSKKVYYVVIKESLIEENPDVLNVENLELADNLKENVEKDIIVRQKLDYSRNKNTLTINYLNVNVENLPINNITTSLEVKKW